MLTAVERDGRPAAAIIHDAQLAEDPELVHAAGAVALLAQENAELEQAWTDSLRQLRESRARIAAAGEVERRALERDLHDGAQQQLTAVLLKLALVGELLPAGSVAQVRLAGLECELEQTLEELRRLAHGIYPVPLAEAGIVGALEAVAKRSGGAIDVVGHGIGRYPPEVESAVYYCCLEAVQNATKHGGPGVGITIRLCQVRRRAALRGARRRARLRPGRGPRRRRAAQHARPARRASRRARDHLGAGSRSGGRGDGARRLTPSAESLKVAPPAAQDAVHGRGAHDRLRRRRERGRVEEERSRLQAAESRRGSRSAPRRRSLRRARGRRSCRP